MKNLFIFFTTCFILFVPVVKADSLPARYNYSIYQSTTKGVLTKEFSEQICDFDSSMLEYNKEIFSIDGTEKLQMSGVLRCNYNVYEFTVSGETNYLSTERGLRALSTPLYGYLSLEETEIDIVIGINTVSDVDSITLNLSQDGSSFHVAYGSPTTRMNLNSNDKLDTSKSLTLAKEDINFSSRSSVIGIGGDGMSGSWSHITSKYGYLNFNGVYTKGLYFSVYKDPSNDVFRVSTKSYISDFDYLLSKNSYNHFSVILQESSVSMDYIKGTASTTEPGIESGGSSVLWRNVMLDVFAVMNLPTWTINHVFESVRGGVYVSNSTYSQTVKFYGNNKSLEADMYRIETAYKFDRDYNNKVSIDCTVKNTYRVDEFVYLGGQYTFYPSSSATVRLSQQ